MTDRVYLSASHQNIDACIRLAQQVGAGIEIMHFSEPGTLDGDWQADAAAYRRMLAPLDGRLTMHGPFKDMAPGSPDALINGVTRRRYEHALQVAHDLGVGLVVFHANFIAQIHTPEYRRGWHERSVAFWGEIGALAARLGVRVAVENMWEFDPDIIGDVLKAIRQPQLGACLDVGHAHLYSDVPFKRWLEALDGLIIHTHLNNNDGVDDIHRALSYPGSVDYTAVLPGLRALPSPPGMTLELDTVEDMEASLPFFALAAPRIPDRE